MVALLCVSNHSALCWSRIFVVKWLCWFFVGAFWYHNYFWLRQIKKFRIVSLLCRVYLP